MFWLLIKNTYCLLEGIFPARQGFATQLPLYLSFKIHATILSGQLLEG